MKPSWHNLFRTIPAALCLVAYLFATPLAPLGTAVLAWIDGEHQVRLAGCEHGGTTVVLAHNQNNLRQAPTHHHCLAASALVLFAAPISAAQPDHVLSFEINGSSAVWERLPALQAPTDATLSSGPADVSVQHPVRLEMVAWRLEAPPDPTSLVVARSTVFLI